MLYLFLVAGLAVAKTGPDNYFKPTEVTTEGSVTVEGKSVHYHAIAGTLVIHPKGWDDAPISHHTLSEESDKKKQTAEAAMFYVYYSKDGAESAHRPVTFLYNGGPGSSTVWLHMGAFGPRRVVTTDDSHTPAAPYRMVDNEYSLLDVSDLVFIDAPATGFGRLAGKDKEKAFFGVDPDGYAFARFITQFLSRYGRWNSPKYLFGESYGTTRSAVVANLLERDNGVDLNGVILLSQILNFDLSVDDPDNNPGVELPYELALPTQVMLNAGYFDLATPFFEGVYEMDHLPIPPALQANIQHCYYLSGHMVYAHLPSLKQLHDNVAAFISRTDNLGR
ncbi:MAG: S10 family serine carboxypeptidase-like protein [Candidatus Xenobia bacterium]